MKKLDLRKELKHLYNPSVKGVDIVNVPKFNLLMLDGEIGAGESIETSQEFQNAIQALYGASYTLKFTSKLRKKNPIDYPVMTLEGLWWTTSGEFDLSKKEDWRWTMMIMQPKHVTERMLQDALKRLKEKRDDPSLSKLRLKGFHEGFSMQIMHVGPYSEEPRTIEKMKNFAQENGYSLRGKHHEIYLGDPRRAKPEKLRTVLRHPIEKL